VPLREFGYAADQAASVRAGRFDQYGHGAFGREDSHDGMFVFCTRECFGSMATRENPSFRASILKMHRLNYGIK
jgi:hypothetical protein